ncbi:glycerol channel [Friedmanniomyces endolithicus]|nr:glycerol channel [Friedmanniomyces endolithicus]
MAGLGIEKMEGDDGMKIHHTELTPSTIRHGHDHSDSSAGTPTPTSPPYGEHGGLMHRVSTDGSPAYAEHGPTIDRSPTADLKKASNAGLRWPRIRRMIRAPLSEFMGVMLGVYASGISGAHINPAVTFANCIFRKFPWKNFPIYAAAQVLGAFCASGVVYANYKSAIDTFEGGPGLRTVPGYSPNASAGIFCTYPAAFMTKTLMFMIYALKDDANIGAGPLTPLGLFFIIFGIGACFGWETGYAINLARDFGPRLMSVPMIAPFFGCTFGGFLYDVLLFTGESPINTPYVSPTSNIQGCLDLLTLAFRAARYFGLYRFIPGMRHAYDGVSFKLEDLQEESAV